MEIKLSSIVKRSNVPDSNGCIIPESAISNFIEEWKKCNYDTVKEPKSLYETNPNYCNYVCSILRAHGIIADPKSIRLGDVDFSRTESSDLSQEFTFKYNISNG